MYLEQTNKSPKPEDGAHKESDENPASMRYISGCSCQAPVTNTGKRKQYLTPSAPIQQARNVVPRVRRVNLGLQWILGV